MLETHISQVAQQQASMSILTGTFPRQPESNLKGKINIVMLQSKKDLENVGKKSEKFFEESEVT